MDIYFFTFPWVQYTTWKPSTHHRHIPGQQCTPHDSLHVLPSLCRFLCYELSHYVTVGSNNALNSPIILARWTLDFNMDSELSIAFSTGNNFFFCKLMYFVFSINDHIDRESLVIFVIQRSINYAGAINCLRSTFSSIIKTNDGARQPVCFGGVLLLFLWSGIRWSALLLEPSPYAFLVRTTEGDDS